MRYGRFDDGNKEYVIERPDTPRSWSNYIGSRKYGGVVTQNAGGYSFSQSPFQGRFLRMRYNSVPMDQPGRYLYLRDRDSGDFWSASWQPVGKPLDRFTSAARFGTCYAVIESEYDGVRMETSYFVPRDAEFEYWWLKVVNTGSKPRKLSLFSFAEFASEWNVAQDAFNLQYTAYIAEAHYRDGLIEASMCGRLAADPDDFANRDQSRRWWMAQAGAPVAAWDLDRDKFLGAYGSFHNPAAVVAGRCGNSPGVSDNICGAMQSDLDLAPGAAADVLVLVGIGNRAAGERAVKEFGTPARAAAELARLKKHWHGLIDWVRVETPDPDFDHMVNVWNSYNALMTFTWARACSLVYTGDGRDGLGFRDALQDCLGVTGMAPDLVRERLVLMLSGQESTGGARPEIKPWLHRPGAMEPTDPRHYRSDDCLWFFNTIPAYVAETGDDAFYNETVPYSDKGGDTVFGHLRRALEFNLERTGRNGLPSGLAADWNDCLKLGYKGESVFVAFQVRLGLGVYADVAERLGKPGEAAWAREERRKLDAKIQETCWDGEWFLWAVGEDGTVYGSHKSPEGRIYLNTQVWAVISGAAGADQAKACLDSVHRRLASEFGLLICEPPFEKTPVEVMRAVLMNPGNKENGGIFSHTQSWGVIAECLAGNGDRAYQYYRAFMPSAYNDRGDVREVEPFVHCQSTFSRFSPKCGASRVPWLSGTASWACFSAVQHILGLRPEREGFRIDPCLPAAWNGFTARRRFRGMNLEITVRNPKGLNRGVKQLRVDGREVPGDVAPLAMLKDGCPIEAEITG